jgi:hypothetical protein
MKQYARILFLLASAAVVASCDEGLSSLAGPTPNLEPTFSSIQREIFEASDSSGRSLCVGCHTNVGRNPSGGTNLLHDVAYDQLVNVGSTGKPGAVRVVPGNPDASYLVQKLEGRAGIVGLRMPRNGPPYLTDGQIMIVRRWIEIGAPRN